jgi:hypothetical protein
VGKATAARRQLVGIQLIPRGALTIPHFDGYSAVLIKLPDVP